MAGAACFIYHFVGHNKDPGRPQWPGASPAGAVGTGGLLNRLPGQGVGRSVPGTNLDLAPLLTPLFASPGQGGWKCTHEIVVTVRGGGRRGPAEEPPPLVPASCGSERRSEHSQALGGGPGEDV